MIYLDNAATTYPKPRNVYQVWQRAMSVCGANPGRSGHRFSQNTAEQVYKSRESCAEFFGADPENTVFTLNCTHALNFAIKGITKRGCNFVISDMEHNAVFRPVYAAAEGNVSVFEVTENDEQTVRNAERAITPDTAAVVFTAASNVMGLRTPVKEIAKLCEDNGVCCIIDAAQGAGTLPITLGDGVNIICASGHKGLYGPMGTGLMVTDGKFALNTIIEGGTGSVSESVLQPDFLPDRFESGTINTAGAVALGEGVRTVARRTPRAILDHELDLCERFCKGISKLPNVTLYNNITPANREHYAPVVSFNVGALKSDETTRLLSDKGFCLRGGIHCAPLAHKKLGTLERGTVRFSPGMFTSANEVDALVNTIARLNLQTA